MGFGSYRLVMATAVIILATSACGTQTVPSSNAFDAAPQGSSALQIAARPADSTSILKQDTKDVVIGSTVDTKNGDEGPRAITVATCKCTGKLKEGQLLICNFEDSSGASGNGTTMEILNPKPSSKPVRFAQNDNLKGCDGDAIQPHNGAVYGTGITSNKVVEFTKEGVEVKTWEGKDITSPLADTAADHQQNFSPLYIYAGSTTGGGINSISVGFYGNGLATQVADGFAVSKSSGEELGPDALQVDNKLNTLYIGDGANNTVVAFSNASQLLDKDEIVVKAGGKTFSCKYPKTTCATLVYSGSPLNAPIAAALLPNGNLVFANSQGTANMLVELTPQGKVLDTAVVDTSSTQGIFGLAAAGTNDGNTVLFYSDTNDNSVHELEK